MNTAKAKTLTKVTWRELTSPTHRHIMRENNRHIMPENNLHEQMQSAYRQNHSTETALLKVHSDILSAVDNGCVVVLVLLDLKRS